MAISFVVLVVLLSFRNEPKKMTDFLCFNPLVDCPLAQPRQKMGRRDSAALSLGHQLIINGLVVILAGAVSYGTVTF